MRKQLVNFVLSLIGPITMIIILSIPIGPLLSIGGVLQPIGGVFGTGTGVSIHYGQSLRIPGLSSQVEVVFDKWGIPHIYADSVHDAFLALGYIHARERLAQIVLEKYVAAGRLGEIVGSGAINSDKFYRTIGLMRAAEVTYQWFLDNQQKNAEVAYTLDLINAEVAGINAFIKSMTSEDLPIEFKLLGVTPENWTPTDVILLSKVMDWMLSGNLNDLYFQWLRQTINNDTLYKDLFPDLLPYTVPIIPEQFDLSLEEFPNAPGGFPALAIKPKVSGIITTKISEINSTKLKFLIDTIAEAARPFNYNEVYGSNNWVVDGTKSATGYPILANDPHLNLQAPSVWYEAHIVVPGVLDVAGVTSPGEPGVVLGHIAKAAWGFTNVGADVLDIFIEKLNPSDPDQYMYNGIYQDFRIIDETIHVKGAGDVPYKVKWSVHGPCIDSVVSTYGLDEDSNPNLAMNWTGLGVTHELISIAMLNRANNLQDYFNAVYWWDSPPQNMVFADDSGNIAITSAGRFPVRSGYSGEYPVTALNDSVGITGYIPYALIPRSVNPSQHYLQSANQKPIDPLSYEYELLGSYAESYRGRRIDNLLRSHTNISVDDMKKFQADSLDVAAQELVPYVIKAWTIVGDNDTGVQEAVNWLSNWNYKMETDNIAPTFWKYLSSAMIYETFDELRSKDNPTDNTAIMMPSMSVFEKLVKENDAYYFDDHMTTGIVETRDQILVRALKRALNNMVSELGNNKSAWKYGNQHYIYVNHIAGITHIGGGPQRGDENTINAAYGWKVTMGPSWRMIIDLSKIDQSYGAYPGGQSGNPFSSHWSDLFYQWYSYDNETEQYGYHTMYFYPTANAFRSSDTSKTMIEGSMTLIP
jgi:penicillin amidase